jgi:hypothetical protein
MKRPTRRTIVSIVVAAGCLAALALVTTVWAKGFENAANAGKAQAKAGAQSLAARDATAAASQFGAASESFARAQAMLGPEWLGGVANTIPQVGRQYSVARTLVAIGLDGSTAGTELSAFLRETQSASATAGSTRLGSLLGTGRQHIDTALAALCDIADRSVGLTDEGLVPPLAKAIREVKDALASVAPYLDRSSSLLALERYLLSSERRILVISQNSAELRPTGGFAGTFAILHVGPQGFALEKYADVWTLPNPARISVPPPGAPGAKHFGFRDANWWIDFPTSARAMLGFWEESGQPPVDGIIAIDVVAVRDLLEVFGPINVPDYRETFTAENLLDRLLYLVEVKFDGGPGKKGVLVALANELEQRVLGAGSEELARSALVLAKAADSKHVQMYFPDAGAQAAVIGMRWSGAIAPPAGTTDLLAVCNAMNVGSKINIAIRKAVDYEVALEPDGSAETTLVLDYSNTAPFDLPQYLSVFSNYLRVYRASGTMIVPDEHPSKGSTSTVDIGLPTAVRTFTLLRGRSHRETIVTRVPEAWRPGSAAVVSRSPAPTGAVAVSAPSTADGASHYRLFIVRQADLQDVPTTVTITPSAGWRVSSVSAWKVASGEALAVTSNDSLVRLARPLDGDMVLDVEMVPK